MARPQVERGFVMIACDLFAALSVADWPKREWTVLAEILLQVYGPQKRREAHVDPRLIEHYSGLSAKNVYRALKNLKACGVIAETASGSYRFVKDFESWDYEMVEKVSGNPVRTARLNDGDRRFALSANDRYGVDPLIKKSKPVGIQLDTNGIQLDTVLGWKRYPTGYQTGAETVSNGILPGGKEEEKVDGLTQDAARVSGDSLASAGARASEDLENLELRENSIYTDGGRAGAIGIVSQAQRTAEDSVDVREAEAFLASDLRTHHLAMELGRSHNLPEMVGIAGWKWLVAARKILEPGIHDSARRSIKYLAKIAGNAIESERHPAASSSGEAIATPPETPEQRTARLAKLTADMRAHRAKLAGSRTTREGRSS